MKTRTHNVNSPAPGSDREHDEGWKDFLLKLFVGVILAASAGIVFSSGFFVLRFMMQDRYELQHAAQIGDFWAGHLGALVLVFVALSMVMQARALKLQGRALTAQLRESEETLKVLRGSALTEDLKTALEGIREHSERMDGFVIEYNEDQEEVKRTEIRGLSEICRYLQRSNETLSQGAMEVYVSTLELDAYMNNISNFQSQLGQVAWPSGYKMALAPYCPSELVTYHDQNKKDRQAHIAEIDKWGLDRPERERLQQLVHQGWSYELAKVGEQFAMTAHREVKAGTQGFSDPGWYESAAAAAKALLALPDLYQASK